MAGQHDAAGTHTHVNLGPFHYAVCVYVCACVCFTVASESHRMGDQDIPLQCTFTDIIPAHSREEKEKARQKESEREEKNI